MNLKSILDSYKTFMVRGLLLEEWGISLPVHSWSKHNASAYSLTRGQCLRERCSPYLAPAGVERSVGSSIPRSALMTALNTELTAPVPFNSLSNIYPVIAISPRLPKFTEFYKNIFCIIL